MADQLEIPTGSQAGGGTMAGETAPAGGTVPANQQQSGDDRLAAILAKKDAGEVLTPQERGYLGAIKRKAKPKAMAAAVADNPLLAPPSPVAPPADNPLFTSGPTANEPAANLAGAAVPPAFDTALVQAAANALLDGVDTATQMYIGYEAKAAGADEATVKKYESAVALQDGNRKLMVENSQPVILTLCRLFNCTPDTLTDTLRNCGFGAGLIAHSLAVVAAVKSIRESRQEKEQQS